MRIKINAVKHLSTALSLSKKTIHQHQLLFSDFSKNRQTNLPVLAALQFQQGECKWP